MGLDSVNKRIETIDTALKSYVQVVDTTAVSLGARQNELFEVLLRNIDLKITEITTPLIRASEVLAIRVTYSTVRLTLHASPEIIEILLTWLKIDMTAKWVISLFKVVKVLSIAWQVNQIILEVWPHYRAWFEGLLTKLSEFSNYLGWGVDGIIHVMNAAESGLNVVGGLMGKDWTIIKTEGMEKGMEVAGYISKGLQSFQADPGAFITRIVEGRTLETAWETKKWWDGTLIWINKGIDKGKEAAEGVKDVISEVSAIQNNMPEEVRKHIPQGIWDSLADIDEFINDYIFPTITKINNSLQWIEAIQGASINRFGVLADKLANPGEILLGVDDLPEYAKAGQLGMIDDVTSREFDFWTNTERGEMQGDFDEFDRIDRLATAPTPEPGFLTMEIPVGKTIRGITAEPKETWFVDGYDDPK